MESLQAARTQTCCRSRADVLMGPCSELTSLVELCAGHLRLVLERFRRRAKQCARGDEWKLARAPEADKTQTEDRMRARQAADNFSEFLVRDLEISVWRKRQTDR